MKILMVPPFVMSVVSHYQVLHQPPLRQPQPVACHALRVGR